MRKKLRIDLFFKPAPTSKQHISAFRALILKNLVSFGKIFQFSAIWVLLEDASSNSLEVMSQWSNNPHTDRLKKIARKVWRGITQDNLQKLNKIMPRCIEAVIGAKGAHIKYWSWL